MEGKASEVFNKFIKGLESGNDRDLVNECIDSYKPQTGIVFLANQPQRVEVVVSFADPASAKEFMNEQKIIESATSCLPNDPCVCYTTLEASGNAFDKLSRQKGFKDISFNAPIQLCVQTVSTTGGAKPYSLNAATLKELLHLTGVPFVSNQDAPVACVLDTGVDCTHLHFDKTPPVLKLLKHERLNKDQYHSTHMCSIIAGAGNFRINTDDSPESVTGVMEKARIIPLQIYGIGSIGNLTVARAADKMSRLLKKKKNSFQVLNLSWTLKPDRPDNDSKILNEKINDMHANGRAVVVAAGNPLIVGLPVRSYAPANHDKVITVGCKGCKYEKEPDILAPDYFYGARAAGFNPNNPDNIVTADGKYVSINGSSMAAAFVTGVCLLLLSQYPYCCPCQLKKLLCDTKNKMDGMVDANAALAEMEKCEWVNVGECTHKSNATSEKPSN